ncbi:MAG: hypothetical protein ACXVSU_06325 [Solirubrobacteraceae bacterium]
MAVTLAKNSVGTAQLKNGAVTGRKLASGAVDASKVKHHSLVALDFEGGQLPRGARGPQGPAGPGESIFASPGTAPYTVPAGVTHLIISLRGGGGGSSNGGLAGDGGGGAGGASSVATTGASPTTLVQGSGGAGGGAVGAAGSGGAGASGSCTIGAGSSPGTPGGNGLIEILPTAN